MMPNMPEEAKPGKQNLKILKEEPKGVEEMKMILMLFVAGLPDCAAGKGVREENAAEPLEAAGAYAPCVEGTIARQTAGAFRRYSAPNGPASE